VGGAWFVLAIGAHASASSSVDANDAGGVVNVRVTSGGAVISDMMPIIGVRIAGDVGSATAELVLPDDASSAGDMEIADSDVFAPGAALAIFAGSGGAEEQMLFTGRVVAQRLSRDRGDGIKLTAFADGTLRHRGAQDDVLSISADLDAISFDMRLGADGSEGDVESAGAGPVAPGDMVGLTIFGDRFSGRYRVTAVEHAIRDGAWTTRLSVAAP
jgi:hypothetical protein